MLLTTLQLKRAEACSQTKGTPLSSTRVRKDSNFSVSRLQWNPNLPISSIMADWESTTAVKRPDFRMISVV